MQFNSSGRVHNNNETIAIRVVMNVVSVLKGKPKQGSDVFIVCELKIRETSSVRNTYTMFLKRSSDPALVRARYHRVEERAFSRIQREVAATRDAATREKSLRDRGGKERPSARNRTPDRRPRYRGSPYISVASPRST